MLIFTFEFYLTFNFVTKLMHLLKIRMPFQTLICWLAKNILVGIPKYLSFPTVAFGGAFINSTAKIENFWVFFQNFKIFN